MSTIPTTSKTFNKILQFSLGKYMNYLFNVEYTHSDEVKKLEPPYLLLANHTNFWDPFLVASYIPEPVHFVTSDEYFRNLFLRTALKWVGAIPKTKFFSDSRTIRSILQVKRNKGVIGIFPEGRRNWDGTTLELLYPTAKLIKKLKIPVVTGLMKGAALSYPRWASKPRKGKLILNYKVNLTTQQIKNLSVDEIYQQISKGLAHDEYQFQRKNMIPYQGKRLAENLELFLFTCPNCQSIGNLQSEDDRFYCQCGYQVKYNKYGFFEQISDHKLFFDNPRDWNLWQMQLFEGLIYQSNQDKNLIIQDNQITLFQGERAKPLKRIQVGQLSLTHNYLFFGGLSGNKFSFPIEAIHGANIQYNDKFEFYYNQCLYRFVFNDKHTSAYKWVQALHLLKNNSRKRGIL